MSNRLSRRAMLANLGAMALSQLPRFSRADTSVQKAHRIDVHHHILPPEYIRLVGKEAIGAPSPNHDVPSWTVRDSLSVMDQYGVRSAIVSVSAPGVWFSDNRKAQRVARACNEFAAQMHSDYPTRFGYFAAMPLPDVETSIAELAYALDELKCDGVGLMTNYGERFLGDAHFGTFFDELNRRKAVVYVHPTSCDCDRNVLPSIPASMIEFPHNTTRTIVSLLFSGTFTRCPNIQFIFSHAGGTLPYIASRVAGVGSIEHQLAPHVPNGIQPVLQKLYFDTASAVNALALPLLLKLVSANNVLLGTDYPFSATGVKLTVEGLSAAGLTPQQLEAIESANALRLFPRLQI